MTDELWRPGVDPNAETQAVPAPGLPHQAEAPEQPLAETALYLPSARWADGGEPARPAPRRGRATRRRVLFAVGGITLLGVGGAAYAMDGGDEPTQAAGPATSARPASASGAASVHHGPSGAPTRAHTGAPHPPASKPPAPKVPKAPQWYVDDAGPMGIALTMDDGPDAKYTPQVLEVLAHYRVKATFNMIGRQVGANLSLVREVSAAGHTITNHTWDHADLTHYTVAQVLSEMDRCNDALAAANQHPSIFRAPYGNWSTAVYEACAARGLRPVGWSVDPRDWDVAHVDTAQIVQNVLRHTQPHSIILEHDGGGVRSNTVAALKIFIPALLERGFHFVAM